MNNAFFRVRVPVIAAVLAGFVSLVALSGCKNVKGTQAAKGYDFTSVAVGTLEKTVSSSGSLQPVSTVKIRAQMSGKVEKVYFDYNDTVHIGDILAELNTDMLRLQRDQQAAQVTTAQASYDLEQLTYQSQQRLAEKSLISEFELKQSKASLDSKAAALSKAKADLNSTDTEIRQYAYITSPIEGIVLERNINVGDTATENGTTALFTLAENLTEMQIQTGVGELDVSSIYKNQVVRFTLDALTGRTFAGVVSSVRLIPTVSNSVASYTVIISVENTDGSLLPGMTCAIEFIEERRENVLRVPNAALRYSPTSLTSDEIATLVFNAGLDGMDEDQQAQALAVRDSAAAGAPTGTTARGATGTAGLATVMMPTGGAAMRAAGGAPTGGAPGGGAWGGSGAATTAPSAATITTTKPLWYLDDQGKLACIIVNVGISDGSYTEVSSSSIPDDLLRGMQLILKEKV